MKCPICKHEMKQDKFGYDCDHCERYFSNMVIEYGIFDNVCEHGMPDLVSVAVSAKKRAQKVRKEAEYLLRSKST